MKISKITGNLLIAISLSLPAAAFADIGSISFYGNNATRASDLVQGCDISAEQVAGLDYRVVTVSDGLWDNGAACGRKYRMRCISTPDKHSCTGNTIDVVVVGKCPNGRCAVAGRNVVMKIAFNRYALLVRARSAVWANIEFIQI
ncbi:hypothetical protein LBW62_24630 [Ralstonia solanacearum]|uniref:hypothetical protein n=1 Tax=Ralstonia solanacearum TaxID=305 RepID=UPI0009BC0ECB|nr:hypothetical protein [Ralstonia solanacearum]MDB0544437.1 hypothetical protein [Ralstonia solanacearum]MDB0554254.1 hypothetical protein [Ralstonia solanacearum]MDB0559350.1 hypothetical protein [Ralstonia solanacearum]